MLCFAAVADLRFCAQDFKKLVEDLLQELMSELGVSDEQFVQACEKAGENPVHKKIVD